MGRYEEGENVYSKMLEKNKGVKAKCSRAYCRSKQGKYKEAEEEYNEVIGAIEDAEEKRYAVHNRGICRQRLGMHKEAVNDYTTLISLDATNAAAYFNRGMCYEALGNISAAINDYSAALELENRI